MQGETCEESVSVVKLTDLPEQILLLILEKRVQNSASARYGVAEELFHLPQVCRSFRSLLSVGAPPLYTEAG